MEDVRQRAERDLPALRQWVDRSLAVAHEMTDNVQHSENDHLAFMAVCFLVKQIDHARSILALIPSRDVILIARSMIEGLCQLLWAGRDPEVLPFRWRAFAWVHEWRVIQAKIAAGKLVDPEWRAAIEGALRKYGDQFLTTKAREARDKGASPPGDPYHKDWRTGRQIRQIFELVEGEDLYRKLYEPFSDRQHWGAGGFKKAIVLQENRIVYSSLSATDAATALATAIQCLLQTVKFVDEYLDLGLTSNISELRDGYSEWSKSH